MGYNIGRLTQELRLAGVPIGGIRKSALGEITFLWREGYTPSQADNETIKSVMAQHVDKPLVGELKVDEKAAAKLFLKHRKVIADWIATSPNAEVIKPIIYRQGSVVDKELLELVLEVIQEDIANDNVTLDTEKAKEFTDLLSFLLDKFN